MNKTAAYHYYQRHGCAELNGKSLFDCHKEASREKIIAAMEKLKDHANEIFLGVGVNNQRTYINPVRGGDKNLVGYFECFELNQQL